MVAGGSSRPAFSTSASALTSIFTATWALGEQGFRRWFGRHSRQDSQQEAVRHAVACCSAVPDAACEFHFTQTSTTTNNAHLCPVPVRDKNTAKRAAPHSANQLQLAPLNLPDQNTIWQ